jgi:hypothetical protein
VPCNFIFYKIVPTRNFNFHQQLFCSNILHSSSSSTSNSLHTSPFPNYILCTFLHFNATSDTCSWMMYRLWIQFPAWWMWKWSEWWCLLLNLCVMWDVEAREWGVSLMHGAGKNWSSFCALSRGK